MDKPNQTSLHEALDLLQEIRDMERYDDADYRKLRREISRLHRRRVIKRFSLSAAAVIIPLIITGILMMTKQSHTDFDSLMSDNSPILELPDGKQVVIDFNVRDNVIAEAASLSVKVDDGVLTYEKKGEVTELLFHTLRLPKGTPCYEMALEDGTRVWLHADSKLTFPSVFPEGERRVYVEGEAYFEVTHDKQKPFIVSTDNQLVTVIGTKFNISAYADESNIVTTLIAGSVAISDQEGENRTVLSPGQQSVFDRQTGLLTVSTVETDNYSAWKEGLINVEKQTLEEIVHALSRLYNVAFVFMDESSKSITYRGCIPKYEKLTDVLKAIETGSPVEFGTSGQMVTITHKP